MSGNMKLDGGNPSTVNKNPKVIKAAQNEIGKIDVLVCGSCFNVFHFVEEFQLHKLQEDCVSNPDFKQPSPSETKPQVWAFLLWKSSILNENKRFGEDRQADELGSWHLYQNWCKLEEKIRDSWIAAGRAIQGFASIANAKIQEVRSVPEKGRVTATRPESQERKDSPRSQPADRNAIQSKVAVQKIAPRSTSLDQENAAKDSSVRKETVFEAKDKDGSSGRQSRDSSHAMRSKSSAVSSEDNYDSNVSVSTGSQGNMEFNMTLFCSMQNVSPSSMGSQGDRAFNRGSGDSLMPDIDIKEEQMSEEEDEMEAGSDNLKTRSKELAARGMRTNSNKVVRKSIKDTKALDGNPAAAGEEEYVVEKILAKRYNPKKKCFEYLLKWEGYPHEQNTWEPVENMQACENLVEAFERNLAKQKMMQQPRPAAGTPIQPPQRPAQPSLRVSGVTSLARTPQQPSRLPPPLAVRLTSEPPPLAPISQKKVGRPPGPRVITPDSELEHMEAGPSDAGFDRRPVRSSKKKALEQVKSWCGTMAKTEDFDSKRKHLEDSDSDVDDPPVKKIKSEPDYDREWSGGEIEDANDSIPSDEDMPRKLLQRHSEISHLKSVTGNHTHSAAPVENKVVVKRRPGRPRKEWGIPNGVSYSSSGSSLKRTGDNKISIELGLESDSSPERRKFPPKPVNASNSQTPVLVANSKGIITVDPRHVPNLTSGVFIVSKKPSSIVCESQNTDKNNLTGKKSPVGSSKSSSAGNIIVDIKSTMPQSGIIRKTAINSRPSMNPVKIMPKPNVSEQVTSRASTSHSESTPSTSSQSRLGSSATAHGKQISSGLVRLPAPVRSPGSGGPRTPSVRPLVAGQRAAGPHSMAMMSARPGMGLGPRPPLLRPGIRRSPMLGTRPRLPTNVTSMSPGTQVKSGIKPIHAMLGKTVQNYGKLSPLAQQKMALRQPLESANESRSADKINVVTSSAKKDIINVVDPKTPLPRGRPPKMDDLGLLSNKVRDSKLVDSDSLHMEFQEVHSSSDSEDSSDGGLPELPMGDLPPLEPESPPRPLTLCPETGKILMRAEGEPTPPPTPEPVPEPPELEPVMNIKSDTESAGESMLGGSLPILDAEKIDHVNMVVQDGTPEEILPDQRDDDDEDVMQGLGQQTLLKVEMSPGGTTGTLVRRDSGYMDTVRTEQGLTVTKISSSDTRGSQEVVVTSSAQPAKLGGISVPARKLFGPDDDGSGVGGAGVGTELVTITGEDGVVYQIATDGGGGDEGEDGGGQDGACVYVTADQDGEGAVLTLDTAVAEAVAQLLPDQVVGGGGPQFYMKGSGEEGGQVMITSGLEQGGEETLQAQVVAQVVQEGESASGSGGTRRVVLMLPDGNLMMTEVDEEQFAALDLDK